MLDPNPVTRVTVVGIKASEWFKHEYIPSIPDDDDEEDSDTDDDVFSIQELVRICRYHYFIAIAFDSSSMCLFLCFFFSNGVGIWRREGQWFTHRHQCVSVNRNVFLSWLVRFLWTRGKETLLCYALCLRQYIRKESYILFLHHQNVSERRIRFTSNISAKDLLEKIETAVTEMGFSVQKKHAKVSLHSMFFLFLSDLVTIFFWS